VSILTPLASAVASVAVPVSAPTNVGAVTVPVYVLLPANV